LASDPDLIAQLQQALAARERQRFSLPGFRPAAVLVPLVLGEEAPALLFTVRHAGLPTHGGQIAFPGGKQDPEDASLEATALREAQEELGLRTDVTLLGRLDDVPSPYGFIITPVVGVLRGPLSLSPNPGEVAEIFYVPLSTLPGVYRHAGEREAFGFRYTMHEYLYDRFRIWGATAVMVNQLLSLLKIG
jgi:8-oxo-dGTP pyrophosphatase MutT (NUDIX family)